MFIHTDVWETIFVLLSAANLWMAKRILYELLILDNALSLLYCIKNLHNYYIVQAKSYLCFLQRVYMLAWKVAVIKQTNHLLPMFFRVWALI